MIEQQHPHANLKLRYRKYLEIATMITLATFTVGMYLFPKFEAKKIKQEEFVAPIQNIEIPPETQQFEKPPPPARPTVPVESESEDIDEDVTIEETTLDEFQEWDEPPPPPENTIRFIPYDEPPEPIGGYDAIKKNVVYPDIAREAGIEGQVIVQAYVDKDGIVKQVKVLKGIPKTGLDEAAMEAVKKTRFKPAYQRDKPVGVWISIPVMFTLRSN